MRFVPLLCALGLGFELAGCSTSSATAVITRPELMAVSPDDFLGDLRCADDPGLAPGADKARLVGSYVATLFDVTFIDTAEAGLENGFPLPSSPATSCEFPVTFGLVQDTHRYRAQIDAFVQPARSGPNDTDGGQDTDAGQMDGGADLQASAIVAVTEGGRPQKNDRGPVKPRWTATCTRYPFTPDAGAGTGGAPGADAGADVGAGGLPGVQSRDAITVYVNNCGKGLEPNPDSGE
jgi:hypothetical protein